MRSQIIYIAKDTTTAPSLVSFFVFR